MKLEPDKIENLGTSALLEVGTGGCIVGVEKLLVLVAKAKVVEVFPLEVSLILKLVTGVSVVFVSWGAETVSVDNADEESEFGRLNVTRLFGDFLPELFFKIGTTGEEIGEVFTFVVTVVELKVVKGVDVVSET